MILFGIGILIIWFFMMIGSWELFDFKRYYVITVGILLLVGSGLIFLDVTDTPVEEFIRTTQTDYIPIKVENLNNIIIEVKSINESFFFTNKIYYLDEYKIEGKRVGTIVKDGTRFVIREIENDL